MIKGIFKIIVVFVIGITGGIFGEQILWPYFIEKPLFFEYRLEQRPVYVSERKETIIQENTALKEAIGKTEKTIVAVRTQTKKGKGEILEGSGIIITSDGLVLTLAGLVPQGSDFAFFINGERSAFQILKRDLRQNLALVKLEQSRLPTVSFADPEKIKLGERVFLIGVIFETGPEAKAEPQTKKLVNEGIIKTFDENVIKTNIFEDKKLAGSPLFDIEGNLLGINTITNKGEVAAVSIGQIKQFTGF